MARLGQIELDQLPEFTVLERLDSDTSIRQRMQRLKELWTLYDPPAGAIYDVDNLEFDPLKIQAEMAAFFELLVRDRVNQAAKAVTTAFATGGDLDAIASRYPGGVPRLVGETDDRYRTRIWLSANALSPHGVYESYVFWALTADPTLRDATAIARKRGTPNIDVTIMKEGTPVTVLDTGEGLTSFPDTLPTTQQIDAVQAYILDESRKGLTDVVTVRPPRIRHVAYEIDYWLFPSWNEQAMRRQLWAAMAALIEKQRWLGYSHVKAAVDDALMMSGVYNIKVNKPLDDLEIEPFEIVVVDSVKLTFKGRGGFEEAPEPT